MIFSKLLKFLKIYNKINPQRNFHSLISFSSIFTFFFFFFSFLDSKLSLSPKPNVSFAGSNTNRPNKATIPKLSYGNISIFKSQFVIIGAIIAPSLPRPKAIATPIPLNNVGNTSLQ